MMCHAPQWPSVEGSPLTRLLLHYLLLPSGISFFYGLRAVHIGCPEGQLLSCVCRRPHVIFVRVCVRAYLCMYVVHGPAFALLSTCLIYVLALLLGQSISFLQCMVAAIFLLTCLCYYRLLFCCVPCLTCTLWASLFGHRKVFRGQSCALFCFTLWLELSSFRLWS